MYIRVRKSVMRKGFKVKITDFQGKETNNGVKMFILKQLSRCIF